MCQCRRWKDGNKKGDNRAEDPHVFLPQPPHTHNVYICTDTHTHTYIYVHTYCRYFFSPHSPIASHLISELVMLKAQPTISRVTTAKLVMRNLLRCLSTEGCSVDHLPTSILITPLTEIRKSLFLTLPVLFSLCPTGLRLPLLLISGRISPLHTWWAWQTAEIELYLCESSTRRHHRP